MKSIDREVAAGQAVYTRNVLSIYDLFVYVLSNPIIWRCPTPLLQRHYNTNISANHLDIGVGTGYLIDHCRFSVDAPRVALMDLNPNTLDFTAKRIARYRPEIWQQNILEPIAHDIAPFDSIGMNYILHCVPGTIAKKAVAFDHIRAVAHSGTNVFGSTILQHGVQKSLLARGLMEIYNRKGIFSNRLDSLSELEAALNKRFDNVSVRVEGCVALFSAQVR